MKKYQYEDEIAAGRATAFLWKRFGGGKSPIVGPKPFRLLWGKGAAEDSCQNEYITEGSIYDFVNELIQPESMSEFR